MQLIALLFMLVSAAALAGEVAGPKVPVVVELFTSEGCSSCPSADSLLRDLEATQPVPGVEVIPLGLHVTYWDGLGWPDSYGSPAFADRQAQYAEAIGGGTYTPEMGGDGAVGFPGGPDPTLAALQEAAAAPKSAVSATVP